MCVLCVCVCVRESVCVVCVYERVSVCVCVCVCVKLVVASYTIIFTIMNGVMNIIKASSPWSLFANAG